MASKGKGKRTKQVIVTKSASQPLSAQLENKRLNIIPVGRQLQRTPPSKNPNTPIIHKPDQPGDTTPKPFIKDEYDAELVTQGRASSRPEDALYPPVKEKRKSFCRSGATPEIGCPAKMGDMDPETFIQGMQGYQWTETDLEFVRQARQKKWAQKLQQELCEVQKTLKNETQRLELAKASRDKLQKALSETPSCELLLQLCRDVLVLSQPVTELCTQGGGALEGGAVEGRALEGGTVDRRLLSRLQLADVKQAVHAEVAEVTRLQEELATALELREEREQARKEMDNCQRRITTVKENIKALKVMLSELQVELSEKEKASKVARPQEKACRDPRMVKAQGTSAAQKAQKDESPREKFWKGAKEASKAAEALGKAPKSRKMANSNAAEAISKAPKEKALKDEAPKEKSSKEKIAKESSTVRGQGNAHKAAKLLKALPSPKPSESDAEPLRRSKRIAIKNLSLQAAVPQKTASSRGEMSVTDAPALHLYQGQLISRTHSV